MSEPIPHIQAITGIEPRGIGQASIDLLMSQQQIEGTNNSLPSKPNDRTPGGLGS